MRDETKGEKRVKRIDLSGKRFGALIVIGYSHTEKGKAHWQCKCDCGQSSICRGENLKGGYSRSCGCLREKNRQEQKYNLKHGMGDTRIYDIWHGMIRRCEDKKEKAFRWYGGRGIKVCSEWHDPSSFFKWAMENGYRDDLTIDRIDNDGNYEPSNCQWITKSENTKKSNRERR